MALAATTVWEVRTTGNAAYGGGFNAARDAINGIDYTQRDTPILAPTDLYRVAASSLYSDSFTFTNAMVGNLIYIESGTHFTAGWYEITGYTSASHVTLDRDPASEDTSAHKDGVGNVGGATNHPNTISTKVVSGNIIYIQSGKYVKVGANTYVLTTTVAGGQGTPIIWIGYTGSRQTAYGTDRPSFDGDSDNNEIDDTAYAIQMHGTANIFKNIIFTNATTTAVNLYDSSLLTVFMNCRMTSSVDGFEHNTSSTMFFINCEIDNNSDAGTDTVSSITLIMIGCYIHNNTNEGTYESSANLYATNCIWDSNGTCGVFIDASFLVDINNCISYGNTGAANDGFAFTGASSGIGQIRNCISKDNGRYGFSRGAINVRTIIFDYNCYNGNGTAGLNNIVAGEHDTTSDPAFTDAGAGDFTLGAGSPCLNTGFPTTSMAGAIV